MSPVYTAFSVAVVSPLPPAKLAPSDSLKVSGRAEAQAGSAASALGFGAAPTLLAISVLGATVSWADWQPASATAAKARVVIKRRVVIVFS